MMQRFSEDSPGMRLSKDPPERGLLEGSSGATTPGGSSGRTVLRGSSGIPEGRLSRRNRAARREVLHDRKLIQTQR